MAIPAERHRLRQGARPADAQRDRRASGPVRQAASAHDRGRGPVRRRLPRHRFAGPERGPPRPARRRRHVNAAIETLGYSVNQAARNLAAGRTGSVAFVVSEHQEHIFEDPNYVLFVSIFGQELRRRGRHLLLTAAEDTEEEIFIGNYLSAGHVDGALLALPHADEPLLGPAGSEPATPRRYRPAARLRRASCRGWPSTMARLRTR